MAGSGLFRTNGRVGRDEEAGFRQDDCRWLHAVAVKLPRGLQCKRKD